MGVSLPNRRAVVLIALVIGLIALSLPAVSRAAEGLAIVDYQAIFDAYEGTSDAQRTLDRELKDWDEQAKQMRDAIETKSEELESQRMMLSAERLQEKQDELRRLKDDYQGFAESIWGVNGKAAQRNAELTKPIAERILAVIEKVGREMNLKVILDAGTGGVVWADDDVNLTTAVLDDLQISISGGGATGAGSEDD
jgi:outer membrane protein